MKTTQHLLQDISTFTLKIENNYPELYKFLDEEPITIPNVQHPHIDYNVLKDYLMGLKILVKKYKRKRP